MNILTTIQTELKAPKGQYNKFGGFSYRSCEDIVEALKPLLKQHECYLTISDEIVQIGDRIYVKATATLHHEGNQLSTSAFAREPAIKKGMDESQITGAASSYARKYALNGLLAIDDTKDADSRDNTNTEIKRITEEQQADIQSILDELGKDTTAKFMAWLKSAEKVDSLSKIRADSFDRIIKLLERKRK